jgi:hypothetical protein
VGIAAVARAFPDQEAVPPTGQGFEHVACIDRIDQAKVTDDLSTVARLVQIAKKLSSTCARKSRVYNPGIAAASYDRADPAHDHRLEPERIKHNPAFVSTLPAANLLEPGLVGQVRTRPSLHKLSLTYRQTVPMRRSDQRGMGTGSRASIPTSFG